MHEHSLFLLRCTKMQVINKALPNLMDPVYSALCTEKSYLDSFDKERLVYLTADSHNDLVRTYL